MSSYHQQAQIDSVNCSTVSCVLKKNKMKTTLFIAAAFLSTGMAIAQGEPDTTRITFGGKQIIIVGNDTTMIDMGDDSDGKAGRFGGDLTYWSAFEVGINLPMNPDFQNSFNAQHLTTDPSQSFVYSWNFAEQRIRIIKDYFGIVTGLGFTNSRYGFDNKSMRLRSNTDSTWGETDTTLFTGFTKNQLRVNTFNIPILFQINTSKKEDNNFHLSFGAIGGVRIGSNVKYKYDLASGGDTNNKEKGRFNLNPFQLLGTVRLGYKDFGLFANYDILSLYDKDKSELAYPFQFGASFHF